VTDIAFSSRSIDILGFKGYKIDEKSREVR
jgi:hypothetical protein